MLSTEVEQQGLAWRKISINHQHMSAVAEDNMRTVIRMDQLQGEGILEIIHT